MADDKLIFPIGFDLNKGVKEVLKDGDKAIERLYNAFAKKPITVKLRIDSGEALSRSTKTLSGLKREMAEINREWNALSAGDRGGVLGAQIMARYRALTQEAKGYTSTVAAAVRLEDKLARERERSANAAEKAAQKTREYNKELSNQSSYVNNLLRKMVALWSIHSVQSFLTGVRDVTAEFELQRVSLGAIIQDQQRANQLFSEIKSFALQSPLKILDLTKYTKQVAAYGIETEKLFDTTKRLADVSVGLGVDMGRLVLAYGQVKAASYLRAAEIRQFTEAGIPMLELLAKKFTDLQGKMVSTEQVMDLVSKRAVSFSMVEGIFNDMTSAGGMFYNMQEKQAQTLFGMWSKLGDAAAMMYDEIGNTGWVNDGMKTTIGLLESMMRNWETTARVLDSVGVALAVYVIGLKNAAIASSSVTTAEAARLAITNRQIIATPKLIASIIGQNAATRLSTTLTRAHTIAMLKQSAATNVLTRGFWKLTAAMLANPWVAAAAAIAGVVAALFHFIGNAETAAERAEKLNNSVASLKNLEDTTKPLIDTYNELINKTERTIEEQKKLSEVTHELAKQYPGAITAIGNFGEEVELAADKLNQLYQAEKQARMDNTRYELEETEKKIEETKKKISKLQKQLAEGEKWGGGQSGAMVAMSDADKGKILKQIDDLRYGEDGQSGLFGLQQSAEAARRALGLIPSEAAHAVEKFGAWKKELKSFRVEVEDGINTQLFDDSTLDQFKSLDEAMEAAAKDYKEQIELVKRYTNALENMKASEESYAKIVADRAEAEARANANLAAMTRFGYKPSDFKSKDGRASDPRLQTLQEIANKMVEVNKEYDELLKKEGQTKALADTQKLFASSFEQMEATAKKYGFKLPAFEVPQTIEDVQKWYKAISDEIKRLGLKNADKVLIELGFKSDKAAIDKQQKDIEKQIKALADRISRTKTAKEFYDKVLGMTGDIQLSANLAVSVYGQNGQDLQDAIREQIKTAFETDPEKNITIDLSEAIDPDTGAINYNKLAELEEKYKDVLISGRADLRQKLIDEGRKTSAAQVQQWLKDIEKAKDFAQQRIDLATYTANQIAAINARTDLPQADKDKLTKGYQDREAKQLAKLQYDEFKDSAMYVHIFEDLDHASTTALKNMRDRLIALKGQWLHLDPTQVKELTKAIADLDEQIAGRSPFKSILDGFKGLASARPQKVIDAELLTATEELTRREEALTTATKKYTEAQTAQLNAQAEVAQARQDLEDALAVSGGEETAEVKAAREVLGIKIATFNAIKAASADSISAAKTEVDKASEKYEEQKKVIDKLVEEGKIREANIKKIELSIQKIDEYQQQVNEALGGIRKIMEAFGASDEDMQFFDDVTGALNEIVDAGQQAEMSVASFMSGNILGGITSGISAIGGLVSGFTNLFYAGRVKRANKEIKRQQELLDQLDYTYGRLEKAADKAFGADFVANQKQQQKILLAQQQAYMKQYEAEMSKGKKADKEKAQEFLDKARDVGDQIADMQGKIAEQMAGTDVASAARDFASAWLEAYASFGNTTDAIREKFNDMIKNMIVESVMAKTVQMALQPMFDEMDKMYKSGASMTDVLSYAFSKAGTLTDQISNGLEVNAKYLESLGINIRDLYASSDNLKGIAKEVGSASSEEINRAAAIGNSLLYYASTLPTMATDLSLIRQLMERGTTSTLPETAAVGWTDWQKQAMDNYNAIARNTAETVAECRRSAAACEAFAADIHRMIEFSGGKHRLNVKL